MNFTFGIITTGNNDYYIDQIIKSIEYESIPNYQILIIGGLPNFNRKNVEHIFFDDFIKSGWITRKKNVITENAKYENIVYLHDYIKLLPDWYQGQLKKGNDFDIRMDKIINQDGTRFRDWCLWSQNHNEIDNLVLPNYECLLPYDIDWMNKCQYISGSYWIAKKHIMCEFPLDERLCWNQSEDIVWSKQVREKYSFQMNIESSVYIMKPNKGAIFKELPPEKVEYLKNYKG